MALAKYLSATQSLLHDPSAQRFSTAALTTFINTGRSQLALEGECVRFLYGLDGLTLTGTFTSGSPTISAIASTTGVAAGMGIASPNVAAGTTVTATTATTITMSANASASATASVFNAYPLNNTATSQEAYSLPTAVMAATGIKDVIGVRSVTLNFGGNGANQYMLRFRDWTYFQAIYRVYPQLTGNPECWSPFQNKIYLRPIPSGVYPMQWDCTCSVIDLVDDTTVEAIPYSFTDAIPYFAAYLAFMASMRAQDAQNMLSIYKQFVAVGRRNVRSTIVPDPYDAI